MPTSPPPALRSNQRGTRQQSSPWPGDRGFESISLQRSVTSKEVLYELPREVWDNDRKSGTDGSNPVPSKEESDANLFRKSVVASRTKCRLRDPVPPSSRKFSRPPLQTKSVFAFGRGWPAGVLKRAAGVGRSGPRTRIAAVPQAAAQVKSRRVAPMFW